MHRLGVKDGQPFFVYNNIKYHALYDVPHLIKSVRNQLLKYNFQLDNHIISWYDIRETFYIDSKSETTRALPKLTPVHINPNQWQKMRVKYAVQVLSHAMASAMRTAVKSGELHQPAVNTANFIDKIDQLFDALNSFNKWNGKKQYLRPLGNKNPHIEELLQNGIQWVSKIKTDKGKVPPCFVGLKNTIIGVLSLYRHLKEEGMDYLATRRLNQDSLENLFEIIRKRCGYERNPSARMLRLNLRAVINNNLKIATENTNCEDSSNDNNILTRISTPIVNTEKHETLNLNINLGGIQNISLESCSRKYTAGYIIKKCIEKFRCEKCQKYLLAINSVDASDELIVNKAYKHLLDSNGLRIPSKLAAQVK